MGGWGGRCGSRGERRAPRKFAPRNGPFSCRTGCRCFVHQVSVTSVPCRNSTPCRRLLKPGWSVNTASGEVKAKRQRGNSFCYPTPPPKIVIPSNARNLLLAFRCGGGCPRFGVGTWVLGLGGWPRKAFPIVDLEQSTGIHDRAISL